MVERALHRSSLDDTRFRNSGESNVDARAMFFHIRGAESIERERDLDAQSQVEYAIELTS